MTKPTVVIIAGGESSRFFPLNFGTFKGAITLLGKPLIIRALEDLQHHGYHNVVIVVSPQNYEGHGLSGLIAAAKLDLNISFVLQPEAKGMGDAVLQAQDRLDEQFIVTSGYQLNGGELADKLLALPEKNAIYSAPTTEPWEYGMLSLKENHAVGLIEKPAKGREPSNQKIQTLYALTQDFLKQLHAVPESPYNFEKALDLLMKNQPVGVIQLDEGFPSLKYAWHLFDFQQSLFKQAESPTAPTRIAGGAKVDKTVVIDHTLGPVIIEAGARVGHGTRLVGPCYIGKNVQVGDFCLLRGGCSIEAGSVVGAYTELVRSIMLSESSLHQSYVADSIIGNRVKIGAGFLTANRRLDRAPIEIVIKGHRVNTGRSNFGTMVGDDANLGIRVSTMPGVAIGAKTEIYPGSIVYRNVDHQQTIRDE